MNSGGGGPFFNRIYTLHTSDVELPKSATKPPKLVMDSAALRKKHQGRQNPFKGMQTGQRSMGGSGRQWTSMGVNGRQWP